MTSPTSSGICSLSSSSLSDLHSSDDEVFSKPDHQNNQSANSGHVSDIDLSKPWSSNPDLTARSIILDTSNLSFSVGWNLHNPAPTVIIPRPRRKLAPNTPTRRATTSNLNHMIMMNQSEPGDVSGPCPENVSRPCLRRCSSGDQFLERLSLNAWNGWDSRPPDRSSSAAQLLHPPYQVTSAVVHSYCDPSIFT